MAKSEEEQRIIDESFKASPLFQSLESFGNSSDIALALSLDYDGCLCDGKDVETILANNSLLAEKVVALIKQGKEITFLLGSNRQTLSVEELNSVSQRTGEIKYPYAATLLNQLVERINSKLSPEEQSRLLFNRILSTDIRQGDAPGTHMSTCLDNPIFRDSQPVDNEEEGKYKQDFESTRNQQTYLDESKISTIYAQMHEIASQNSDKRTQFVFADDRKDILEGIKAFYEKHPSLIPENITLTCTHHIAPSLTVKAKKEIELLSQLEAALLEGDYPENFLAFLTENPELKDIAPSVFNSIQEAIDESGTDKIALYQILCEKLPQEGLSQTISYWKDERQDSIPTLETFEIQGQGQVDVSYDSTVRAMWYYLGNTPDSTLPVEDTIDWTAEEFNQALKQNEEVSPLSSKSQSREAFISDRFQSVLEFKSINQAVKDLRPPEKKQVAGISSALKDYFTQRASDTSTYQGGISQVKKVATHTTEFFRAGAHRGKKSRQVKLQAAFKIRCFLLGNPSLGLTKAEKAAAQEGRLGSIVEKINEIDGRKEAFEAFLKASPSNTFKEHAQVEPTAEIKRDYHIARLKAYEVARETNTRETYGITAKFFGGSGRTRTVKLTAAKKLMHFLKGEEAEPLTKDEQKAVKNGELKSLVKRIKQADIDGFDNFLNGEEPRADIAPGSSSH